MRNQYPLLVNVIGPLDHVQKLAELIVQALQDEGFDIDHQVQVSPLWHSLADGRYGKASLEFKIGELEL